MSRFRYSIASLLGLVLFAAVAVAAVRQADDLRDSGMFTLSIGLLLSSVLLAIHRSGRRRAFWLGFALFGSAYLIASLVPAVESRLLTTRGLTYLDSQVPGRHTSVRLGLKWLARARPTSVAETVAFSPDGRMIAAQQLGTVRLWDATAGALLGETSSSSVHFLRIGHSLLALVLAFGGGRLSLWMFGRPNKPTGEESHEQRPGS